MDMANPLERALRATGEILAHRGQSAAIVVIGGTALNLLHVIERATRDVDVIATGVLPLEGPRGRSSRPSRCRRRSPMRLPPSRETWACRAIG